MSMDKDMKHDNKPTSNMRIKNGAEAKLLVM